MSVTLKLADSDAALIGEVLVAVGRAEARTRTEGEGLTEDVCNALFGKTVRQQVARHARDAHLELIKLGHAFEVAVAANEPRKSH